jgi:hypothetical protein
LNLILKKNQFLLIALGQLMLYVDGMNAVIYQNEVVQWLYTLIESSVRTKKKLIFFTININSFSFGLLLKPV